MDVSEWVNLGEDEDVEVSGIANDSRAGGLLRTSPRPTLNRRRESGACMSNHPEANACSDLGRVLVPNDPPTG